MWDFEELDRDVRRAQRFVIAVWVVYAVVCLGLLGGGIYLLIRVLSLYGIL